MTFDVNTYQSNPGETARIVAQGSGTLGTEHWTFGDRFDARQALTDDAIEICFSGVWKAIRIEGPFFRLEGVGSQRPGNNNLPERTDAGFVSHRTLYTALEAAKKQHAAIQAVKKALSK